MPYGSDVKMLDSPSTISLLYGNSGGIYYTVTRDAEVHIQKSWSRSGLNSPSAVLNPAVRIPSQKICKIVNIKSYGKRLSYKVFDRKTGKYYFAREEFVTPRVKCFYPKKRKKKAKKIRNQYVIPNPLSFTTTEMIYSGAEGLTGKRYDGYTLGTSAPLWSPFHVTQYGMQSSGITESWFAFAYSGRATTAEANADYKALARFHSRLKDQKVSIAQAAAESSQTIKLITDAAQRIAKVLIAAKRGNLKAASEALFGGKDRVATDWLAIQYGLLPLLSDIDGLMEHLATPQSQLFTVRSRITERYEHQLEATDGCNVGFLLTSELYKSGSVSVTYHATCRITSPVMRDASRLGSLNLLALGWELVPWSFIIDWFLPIGGYLNSMDSFYGVEVLHCHKTIARSERSLLTRDYRGGYDSGGYLWPAEEAQILGNKTSVTRAILPDIPEMPLPLFKNPISAVHIQNLAALLSKLL